MSATGQHNVITQILKKDIQWIAKIMDWGLADTSSKMLVSFIATILKHIVRNSVRSKLYALLFIESERA